MQTRLLSGRSVLQIEERLAFCTFRDPSGNVEVKPDGAYRRVYAPYDAEILEFLASPLASKLVLEGRLVDSEVVSHANNSQPLLLRHPRIAFPTYPWEWAPAMWLSAAELTLNLCTELVKQGWILKDATPMNVLFRGTQPVFVDVLSIQRVDLEKPIWYAYGQFIRTFLLPMLAYSKIGWPLNATMMKRDGYEPEDVFSSLRWRDRLRQPALSAVTLPRMASRMGGKSANASGLSSRFLREPEIARQIILKALSTLLSHMRAATPMASASAWSNYAETAIHYSADDHAAKRLFVAQALDASRPERVLDVGCNSGLYSSLAAEAGAEVISIDTDNNTVDNLCRQLKGSGKHIQPLCVDLSRPTPAVGWENRENISFLDRCTGSFDMVVMLAVIHHLLIGSQIPLDHIAALCERITTRYLIVEWVPQSDPKFQEIMRGREAIYTHLTEAAFRIAFAPRFSTVREVALENGRTLFHFEKR